MKDNLPDIKLTKPSGGTLHLKLTREEIFNVWANRYMSERRKKLVIFLAMSIILTIAAWGFMYTRNADYSWWAMAMMVPVVFKALKTSRDSGNFARKKMKRG